MSVTWGSGKGMEHHQFGYVLIAGGAVLQIAEAMAHSSATLNNITFPETPVGKMVAPLETILPLSVGWTLILAGVALCYVLPRLKG